ncbi:MAG: winged helix-turn-helix transcriptional regulator [Nitrososphaerota archaeon]|nr:winged helix-turn-helix transcriptional regulator [Nitrososphaerota archaeon]MDG6922061.1 winged helix-turn-helix transcriptional regulator [Nitrososphaerota archaeon]
MISEADGLREQILRALAKGRKKMLDLEREVDASKQTILERVNDLVAHGYLQEQRDKFPPTRWISLTEIGRKELQMQEQVSRFRLISSLGSRLAEELNTKKERATEIRRELIRVEPDLEFASYGSLIKWLSETGEWKRLGDSFDILKQNTLRLDETRTYYKQFLDYAFEKRPPFEAKYRRVEGEEDEPDWNPELKYYHGPPNDAPLRFIESLIRGDLDVLDHCRKRLNAALEFADETNVQTLAEALDALDLVKINKHIKSIIEEMEQTLDTVLEMISAKS